MASASLDPVETNILDEQDQQATKTPGPHENILPSPPSDYFELFRERMNKPIIRLIRPHTFIPLNPPFMPAQQNAASNNESHAFPPWLANLRPSPIFIPHTNPPENTLVMSPVADKPSKVPKPIEITAMSGASLDMNTDVLTTMECPVCLESLNRIRIPRVLRCGHTVCTKCLEQILQNAQQKCHYFEETDSDTLCAKCPKCRKSILQTKVQELPINYILLNYSTDVARSENETAIKVKWQEFLSGVEVCTQHKGAALRVIRVGGIISGMCPLCISSTMSELPQTKVLRIREFKQRCETIFNQFFSHWKGLYSEKVAIQDTITQVGQQCQDLYSYIMKILNQVRSFHDMPSSPLIIPEKKLHLFNNAILNSLPSFTELQNELNSSMRHFDLLSEIVNSDQFWIEGDWREISPLIAELYEFIPLNQERPWEQLAKNAIARAQHIRQGLAELFIHQMARIRTFQEHSIGLLQTFNHGLEEYLPQIGFHCGHLICHHAYKNRPHKGLLISVSYNQKDIADCYLGFVNIPNPYHKPSRLIKCMEDLKSIKHLRFNISQHYKGTQRDELLRMIQPHLHGVDEITVELGLYAHQDLPFVQAQAHSDDQPQPIDFDVLDDLIPFIYPVKTLRINCHNSLCQAARDKPASWIFCATSLETLELSLDIELLVQLLRENSSLWALNRNRFTLVWKPAANYELIDVETFELNNGRAKDVITTTFMKQFYLDASLLGYHDMNALIKTISHLKSILPDSTHQQLQMGYTRTNSQHSQSSDTEEYKGDPFDKDVSQFSASRPMKEYFFTVDMPPSFYEHQDEIVNLVSQNQFREALGNGDGNCEQPIHWIFRRPELQLD